MSPLSFRLHFLNPPHGCSNGKKTSLLLSPCVLNLGHTPSRYSPEVGAAIAVTITP